MKYFKIIILFFILFGEVSCTKEEIISTENITEIKVYKSSRRINTDSVPSYRIINEKDDIDRFISYMNEGETDRYIIMNPQYYITVSYPNTIIDIFVSEKYFRTKTSTYELSQDLSQIIENFVVK